MNENAKKWVADLRSGNRSQTTGRLADDKGFCCLGRACEVAISNGLPVEKTVEAGITCYDGHDRYLPNSVREWLNLSSSMGTFSWREDNHICSLLNANDSGMTFSQIADLVESEPEGLFKEEIA